MTRWMKVACAAAALAGSGAFAQTLGPGAASSVDPVPPVGSQRALPSRPSRPMTSSASGDATSPDSFSTAPGMPGPRPTDPVPAIGGSGSSGLAAMGGGLDPAATPSTGLMGAGGLMPECPMGMVRSLGACVTHAQAQRAARPNKPEQAKPQR